MALPQTLKPINVPQTIQQALDLQRRGKLPQAEKLYTEVLSARPEYFEALHMLAVIKLETGDPVAALRMMIGALKARPKSPEVLFNYSLVLDALGQYDEALATLDVVLSIKRRFVEAHNNRGAVLEKLGRNEEALESFRRALEMKSNHTDALYNQASVLRKLGRHDEALKSFDRVLAIKPDHVKAHNNRGTALELLGRREDALASYDRALAIDANFVEAYNNRGNTLLKLGRHEDALACYERALALEPFHAEVLNNRGNALAALGRHREALATCLQAAAVNPNHVNAQWNAGLLQLRLGEFAAGLKQYEWRWKREERAGTQRHYPQPLWLGDAPVADRTILLHREQGFGDTIQFARYAPLLVKQGARVILEVQPPLKSLMATIGAGVEVIGSGEKIPSFDLHCPLMSLPLAFRTELGTIPAEIPYLAAAPERIEQWSGRLPPQRGLRVGLVWSGNAVHKDDQNRSIALARLAPLFDLAGIEFIGLQKDVRDADAETMADERRIADIGRQFDDFCDTAAAITLMDLVIAVDTSVAHLAGALGKPIWVLLPFCPDWRWLTDRDDNPWYPTARLFRQPAIGNWERVIEQVRQELALRAQTAGQNS